MKKTLVLLIIAMIVFSMASMDSLAAKKSKKTAGVVSPEEMETMSATIDNLTKKVYSNSLFSPQDNAAMIEIKIKLDNQMLVAPDSSIAPLYFKAADLYKAREYKKEAIDCYQTILENFPDTALAPKAKQALSSMGVSVVDPNAANEAAQDGKTTGQASQVDSEVQENSDSALSDTEDNAKAEEQPLAQAETN